MKITCLKYAQSVYGIQHIFRDAPKGELLPISFCIFLIETGNQKILVDAGCDECGGFEFKPFRSIRCLLNDLNLDYEDITDVIITHSHYDHIALVKCFENATVYIQTDEYINGKSFIPKDLKVTTFDNEYKFENGIVIKKIGGHSTGSSVVIVDNYVFCGDECYSLDNLKKNILTGASVNLKNSSAFLNEYSKSKYTPLLSHDSNILPNKIGAQIICQKE